MGRLGNGGVDVQSDIKRGENAPSLYRATRDLRCLCHTTAGQALSSPCHLSNARPMGGSSTIERCRNNRQRRQPHQIAKARHERTLEDIGRPGRIGDYSTAPPQVGSRTDARTVGGGFPVARFRWRGGFTVPPWPRFQLPPRQTERAVFPHSAFLFAACQGLWDLSCWERFRHPS